ncbi:UbiA prenyltransferase [Aspergillus heterothallicus]
MPKPQKKTDRPLGRLCLDLIRISRFDRYNFVLATFAGVWATLLAGAQRLQENPGDISVHFVLRQAFLNFVFCSIFCGAGMVWNDWVDRDIDAHVERTKSRPLAAGDLSSGEALLWMLVQFVAAVYVLDSMVDRSHLLTSLALITLGTLTYPYGKRPAAKALGIYPQYILGFTLAAPAVTGWAAIYGEQQTPLETVVSTLPITLFVFVWTMYFNTAYSYQDIRDDSKLCVNSFYVLAGRHIHAVLIVLAVLVLSTMTWVLYPLGSTWLWVTWMGVWSFSVARQMKAFSAERPETGGTLHKENFALGIWNIAALVVEVLAKV